MKKTIALLLTLVMVLALTACGGGGNQGNKASIERENTEDEWAAIWSAQKVVSYLKDVLKKPSSLEINSISGGQDNEGNYVFEVDYSAENGFGGTNREQMYIRVQAGASAEGCSVLNLGDPYFYGASNQNYTKKFYREISPKKYDIDFILGEAEKLG